MNLWDIVIQLLHTYFKQIHAYKFAYYITKSFYSFGFISHLHFINTLEDFFAFRRYENIAPSHILLTSNIFKTDIYI